MEKDDIKEDQINNEIEETVVEASNVEVTEAKTNTEKLEENQENINIEISKLINGEEEDKNNDKNSLAKILSANILDQLLVLAASAVLLLLCGVILKAFGYMFVKESGAIVIAGGIIYFIINCIYTPIMEKSKSEKTIARKILNIN